MSDLADGQLAQDLERELSITIEDLDEVGKKEVEETKKAVVLKMKENAQTFSTQLRDHLAAAKLQAAEHRVTITQAAKKRKAEHPVAAEVKKEGEGAAEAGAAAAVAPPGAAAAATTGADQAEAYLTKLREEAGAKGEGKGPPGGDGAGA